MNRGLIITTLIVIVLCVSSCASKKKYAELEAKQRETQENLNQLIVKNEELVSLIYNMEMQIEELNEPPITSGYEDMDSYAFSYFYTLNSSEELFFSDAFDLNTPLIETSQRIESEIQKMGYDIGNYKFFYTGNGYGIVTNPIPVTPEGKRGDTSPDCNWFNFFYCSGKSYYRMYVFLVVDRLTKKDKVVTLEEIRKYYDKNINLDINWQSLDSLTSLFYGENNKFNEKYSFSVRVYDFLSEDFGNGSKVLKQSKFEPFKESGYEPFKN